jgi:hypothetical protein
LERPGPELVKEKLEGKRAKVTVKEVEVDGVVVLEIQDD